MSTREPRGIECIAKICRLPSVVSELMQTVILDSIGTKEDQVRELVPRYSVSITSHYQDYHGPTAFSTPEARAITDFITTLGNVISYIDFHSYSQLWMHSYGYSCRTNPNDTLLTMGGKLATEALAKRYGTEYRYVSICKTIYRGLWVCDLFFKRMGIVWIGQLVLGA